MENNIACGYLQVVLCVRVHQGRPSRSHAGDIGAVFGLCRPDHYFPDPAGARVHASQRLLPQAGDFLELPRRTGIEGFGVFYVSLLYVHTLFLLIIEGVLSFPSIHTS